MENIPTLGSNEWRYWVIARLEEIQAGDVRDGDIAAIIGTSGSKTRVAINQLIQAGDQEVTIALTAAIEASAVSTQNSANRYADARADAMLIEAKKYTDAHSGSGGSDVTKTYVDDGDAKTLTSSKSYADTVAGNARDTAKTYTDETAQATGITFKSYADNGDATTLAAANRYTDAHSGSGGGVSEEYVANAVSQGVDDAATAATLADQALSDTLTTLIGSASVDAVGQARSYTDTTVGNASTQLSAAAQAAANTAEGNAKTYTDNSIDEFSIVTATNIDAKVQDGVNTSKTYTDNKIAAIPGSDVNKAYVDQQDAATKTSAVNEAKNYTDQKTGASSWTSLAQYAANGFALTLEYKIVSGMYKWRGAVSKTDGTSMASGTVATGIPPAIMPSQDEVWSCPGDGASVTKVALQAGGSVVLSTPTATTTKVTLSPVVFVR